MPTKGITANTVVLASLNVWAARLVLQQSSPPTEDGNPYSTFLPIFTGYLGSRLPSLSQSLLSLCKWPS